MNQDNTPELTMDHLLLRIDNIVCVTDYLHKAIDGLRHMRGHHEKVITAKTQAITDVVKAREETNQKLVALYGRMYDNLRGKD